MPNYLDELLKKLGLNFPSLGTVGPGGTPYFNPDPSQIPPNIPTQTGGFNMPQAMPPDLSSISGGIGGGPQQPNMPPQGAPPMQQQQGGLAGILSKVANVAGNLSSPEMQILYGLASSNPQVRSEALERQRQMQDYGLGQRQLDIRQQDVDVAKKRVDIQQQDVDVAKKREERLAKQDEQQSRSYRAMALAQLLAQGMPIDLAMEQLGIEANDEKIRKFAIKQMERTMGDLYAVDQETGAIIPASEMQPGRKYSSVLGADLVDNEQSRILETMEEKSKNAMNSYKEMFQVEDPSTVEITGEMVKDLSNRTSLTPQQAKQQLETWKQVGVSRGVKTPKAFSQSIDIAEAGAAARGRGAQQVPMSAEEKANYLAKAQQLEAQAAQVEAALQVPGAESIFGSGQLQQQVNALREAANTFKYLATGGSSTPTPKPTSETKTPLPPKDQQELNKFVPNPTEGQDYPLEDGVIVYYENGKWYRR